MTVSDRVVAELRKAAEEATQDEWRTRKGVSGCNWIDAGKFDSVLQPAPVECARYCYGGSSMIEFSDADAAYVAAASPSVVGQLLDDRDALEAKNAAAWFRLRELAEKWEKRAREFSGFASGMSTVLAAAATRDCADELRAALAVGVRQHQGDQNQNEGEMT